MADVAKSKLQTGGILGFLKEFKELLAVLIFFFGGALWIFGYFATKSQIKELYCIMNANVDFIQGRLEAGSLSDLLVDNYKELKAFDVGQVLSDDDAEKVSRLELAAAELTRKLSNADTSTADALNRLRSGECSTDQTS